MDLLSAVLEEIALEGLEGITLESLWLRLIHRRPPLDVELSDEFKAYVWQQVVVADSVRCCVLPKPRPTIEIPELITEHNEVSDAVRHSVSPYSLEVYSNQESGVRGCCSDYNERVDITEQLRCAGEEGPMPVNYSDVMQEYGSILVLVASQEARVKALYGVNSDLSIELTDREYCILEYAGRCRWHGTLTAMKPGVSLIAESQKMFAYYKKNLVRFKLLTSQKVVGSRCFDVRSTVNLIHLRRYFYHIRRALHSRMERLCDILASKPCGRDSLDNLRNAMDMPAPQFKKMYQSMGAYVKVEQITYAEFDPTCTPEQATVKKSNKPRMVRVMTLLKRYKDKVGMFEVKNSDDEDDDEGGGSGDEDDDEEGATSNSLSLIPSVSSKNTAFEYPLLHSVYNEMAMSGGNGLTYDDMSKKLQINKLNCRIVVKILKKAGILTSYMMDKGRQRTNMYVLKNQVQLTDHHKQIVQEKEKQALASSTTHLGSPAVVTSDIDSRHLTLASVSGASTAKFNKPSMSLRKMKRVTLIKEALDQMQVTEGVFHLLKHIRTTEAKEGSSELCDKRSLMRLIQYLRDAEHIKEITAPIDVGSQVKEVTLYCVPTLGIEDKMIRDTIEDLQSKYVVVADENTDSDTKPNVLQTKVSHLLRGTMPKSEMKKRQGHALYQTMMEHRMRRCQVLHQFIFYMTYCHGTEVIDKSLIGTAHPDSSQPDPAETSSEDVEPPVYFNDMNWNRFIPKLSNTATLPDGWSMFGELLINIPICLLVRIFRCHFVVDDLDEYLCHPWKRFLTLQQLPTRMRQQLTYNRLLIQQIYDVLTRLLEMGLVTFEKKVYSEKPMVLLYVHRNATILNTTDPGCSSITECAEQHFQFEGMLDVCDYWFALEWICLNSQSHLIPLDISPDTNHYRSDCYQELVNGKCRRDVKDDGFLPGNRLGAGGLDSSFHAHSPRNWTRGYVSESRSIEKSAKKRKAPAKPRKRKADDVADEQPKKKRERKAKPTKEEKATTAAKPKPDKSAKSAPTRKRKKSASTPTGARPDTSGAVTSEDKAAAPDAHVSPSSLPLPLPLPTHSPMSLASPTPSSTRPITDTNAYSTTKTPTTSTVHTDEGDAAPSPPTTAATPHHTSTDGNDEQLPRSHTHSTSPPTPNTSTSTGDVKAKKTRAARHTRQVANPRRRFIRHEQRKRSSVKPNKEKKRYADKEDEDIMKNLGKRRSTWTEEENVILCCMEVTLQIMAEKNFPMPKSTTLRDVLHSIFPNSSKKSSQAVARRIHNLRTRSKSAAKKICILRWELAHKPGFTDEIVLDPQQFHQDIAASAKEAYVKEVFCKCLELVKREQMNPQPISYDLPETSEELVNQYRMLKFDTKPEPIHVNPTSIEDIHFSILQHVAHSSLLLDNKTNHAQQLIHLFKQYPDQLLLTVFDFHNRNGVVTRNKKSVNTHHSAVTFPTSNMKTYQLSQRYSYIWKTTYPSAFYKSTYDVYKKLLSCDSSLNILDEDTTSCGILATTVALMANKMMFFELYLPEETISVRLTDAAKTRLEMSMSAETSGSLNSSSQGLVKGGKTNTPVSHAARYITRKMPDKTINIKRLLNETSGRYQYMFANPGLYLRMRPELKAYHAGLVENVEHISYDSLCQYNMSHPCIHKRTCWLILQHERKLQPQEVDVANVISQCSDVELAKHIYDTIHQAAYLGISHTAVMENFGRTRAVRMNLKTLVDKNAVLRVGVTDILYVSQSHGGPWLVHSIKKLKGRGVWAGNRHGDQYADDVGAEQHVLHQTADDGVSSEQPQTDSTTLDRDSTTDQLDQQMEVQPSNQKELTETSSPHLHHTHQLSIYSHLLVDSQHPLDETHYQKPDFKIALLIQCCVAYYPSEVSETGWAELSSLLMRATEGCTDKSRSTSPAIMASDGERNSQTNSDTEGVDKQSIATNISTGGQRNSDTESVDKQSAATNTSTGDQRNSDIESVDKQSAPTNTGTGGQHNSDIESVDKQSAPTNTGTGGQRNSDIESVDKQSAVTNTGTCSQHNSGIESVDEQSAVTNTSIGGQHTSDTESVNKQSTATHSATQSVVQDSDKTEDAEKMEVDEVSSKSSGSVMKCTEQLVGTVKVPLRVLHALHQGNTHHQQHNVMSQQTVNAGLMKGKAMHSANSETIPSTASASNIQQQENVSDQQGTPSGNITSYKSPDAAASPTRSHMKFSSGTQSIHNSGDAIAHTSMESTPSCSGANTLASQPLPFPSKHATPQPSPSKISRLMNLTDPVNFFSRYSKSACNIYSSGGDTQVSENSPAPQTSESKGLSNSAEGTVQPQSQEAPSKKAKKSKKRVKVMLPPGCTIDMLQQVPTKFSVMSKKEAQQMACSAAFLGLSQQSSQTHAASSSSGTSVSVPVYPTHSAVDRNTTDSASSLSPAAAAAAHQLIPRRSNTPPTACVSPNKGNASPQSKNRNCIQPVTDPKRLTMMQYPNSVLHSFDKPSPQATLPQPVVLPQQKITAYSVKVAPIVHTSGSAAQVTDTESPGGSESSLPAQHPHRLAPTTRGHRRPCYAASPSTQPVTQHVAQQVFSMLPHNMQLPGNASMNQLSGQVTTQTTHHQPSQSMRLPVTLAVTTSSTATQNVQPTTSHMEPTSVQNQDTTRNAPQDRSSPTDHHALPQVDGTRDGQSDDEMQRSEQKSRQAVDTSAIVGETSTHAETSHQSLEDPQVSHSTTSPAKKRRRRKQPPVRDVVPYVGDSLKQTKFQEVQFISRPWKTPEGTINRSALQMMLESLMYHLNSHPGIMLEDLNTVYEKALQPVCLIELLSILAHIGCVERVCLEHNEEVSLTSERIHYKLGDDVDDAYNVCYIPTIDYSIKLGMFLDQLGAKSADTLLYPLPKTNKKPQEA